MKVEFKNYQSQLQALYNKIKVHNHQYELFCGFMAMVVESPSVTDSMDTLIASFQKLKETGWYLPKNADEMRSLFVRAIMGDYLKCFRCDAKFITNKRPECKLFCNGYYCPVCHNWYAVKEDDSFLKALVSEKQLEETQHLGRVLELQQHIRPRLDRRMVGRRRLGHMGRDRVLRMGRECHKGHDDGHVQDRDRY